MRATSASINWRSSSESLPIGSLISSAIARLAASGVGKLSSWNGSGSRNGRTGYLVRRDGWSGTDHDNIILSRESGARQHEKLCQVAHPIGANLAPCFCGAYGIGAAGSGRRPGDKDRTVPRPRSTQSSWSKRPHQTTTVSPANSASTS